MTTDQFDHEQFRIKRWFLVPGLSSAVLTHSKMLHIFFQVKIVPSLFHVLE
jgi:hypothetical protein